MSFIKASNCSLFGGGSRHNGGFAGDMLHYEVTAYILAAILIFIVGLILVCCCRIWYDLLGFNESRRQRELNPHNIMITDQEESRFKADLSSELQNGHPKNSSLPVMKIVITKAEDSIHSEDEEHISGVAWLASHLSYIGKPTFIFNLKCQSLAKGISYTPHHCVVLHLLKKISTFAHGKWQTCSKFKFIIGLLFQTYNGQIQPIMLYFISEF